MSKCDVWDDAGANVPWHWLFVVSSIIQSVVLMMHRFADSFRPAVSVHIYLNLKKSRLIFFVSFLKFFVSFRFVYFVALDFFFRFASFRL
jgi:hypothetical protein